MAAITGRGMAARPSKARWKLPISRSVTVWIWLISAPAAKTRSLPASTTALSSGSAARPSMRSPNSSSSSADRAFIGGRLNRMSSTPLSRRSVVMNSAMAGTLGERLRQQRLGGGVGVDLAGLDGGGQLVEALTLQQVAGPFVEAGDDDGAQLLADPLRAPGGEAAVALEEGPVGQDRLPQL